MNASKAAKASPQSRAAAGARTANGEVNAPAAPATVVKMPAATRTRTPAQPMTPAASSPTRTGVETTAWYVRHHLSPAFTGYVVTLAAVCIAVVAINAGATNSR